MGMYYEGVETDKYNMDFSAQNGKFADDKEIVDEGRTVAKMSGKAAGAASTPRFAYFAPTAVDANEYKIIDTAFKVDPEGVTGTYTANGVSKFRIYYMPVPGQYIINGANYAAEGLDPEKWSKFIYVPATDTTLQQGYNKYSPYIFNANQKTAFNYTLGEYVKVTWDAEDENLPPYENNNLSIPYGYDGINMGFIVEPYMNAAGPNTDLYLDYFRLYRKGVLEVTYNTNAPAGTTATGEISADTNRGAGTGYVLSTEHPEIEGYDFIGWALNKDAYPNEVVKTIDLTRDTTVYAVWAKKNVPLSYSGNSIRVNEPSGIRFKASLSKTLKNDEKTAEYGFIVTRESFLEDKGMDYLTFKHNDVTYVFGANYKAGTDVDKVYETVDDNVFFTAVIYGIKASEEAYRERLVVRPYIKYDGNTLYGTPMARSIYSVAKSLKDSGYKNLNETEIDYLKGILTVCNEDI